MTPLPIVDLSRAIVVAFSEGPDAGLALLDTLSLDSQLGEYHLDQATRADLLSRLGRPTDALPHYRRALELAPSNPERRFLQRRIDAWRISDRETKSAGKASKQPSCTEDPCVSAASVPLVEFCGASSGTKPQTDYINVETAVGTAW